MRKVSGLLRLAVLSVMAVGFLHSTGMAVHQGIKDHDTRKLEEYMDQNPHRHQVFIDDLLKKNEIKKSALGHRFAGSDEDIRLKNYEVAAVLLRDQHSLAFLDDEPNPAGAFGLAKLLAKRGFYPFEAETGDEPCTLEDFRNEVLESLDTILGIIKAPQNPMKAEQKANLAFHGYLWKAIIFMDGYDQEIWGGENRLEEAWDSLLKAQELKDKYNFSRSVYLWKSVLVTNKGYRHLVVPEGEDKEAYHKNKANEWLEIYREIQPAPIQPDEPALRIKKPVKPNYTRRLPGRTDYTYELKATEKGVKNALAGWPTMVEQDAALDAPGYGDFSALSAGADENASSIGREEDDLLFSSPVDPSSDEEDGWDSGAGEAAPMEEVRGPQDETVDSLGHTEKRDGSPLKRASWQPIFPVDGAGEPYRTPNGKGPMPERMDEEELMDEEESVSWEEDSEEDANMWTEREDSLTFTNFKKRRDAYIVNLANENPQITLREIQEDLKSLQNLYPQFKNKLLLTPSGISGILRQRGIGKYKVPK